MPKRTDIHKILIIGSGPIVIGQACEFDYSGAQACKALREEGFSVVLVNSNPATIMTDPEMADRTYIEPLTSAFVEEIIAKERPDALLPTLGGQTGLNLAVQLAKAGVLDKYKVQLIGADLPAIHRAEDREEFQRTMATVGLELPRGGFAHSVDEAKRLAEQIGYPCVLRPSFTLGGSGGGVAHHVEELIEIAQRGIDLSLVHEISVEESVIGWKEFELEVMRDRRDNVVIICSIENFDPMGVHTGDSITVAPAQTLTDKEYQRMRDAAIRCIRAIGVETGGSNIQFAIHPQTGRMLVIEMNPRVSRSSALASKATGFPIAKIAAKLAVGYTLDELPNDITQKTPACFEPTIDYVVVKIPRFNFEKFPEASPVLTLQMKSVGETMAIGRTFKEALQKGLRGLEIKRDGLDPLLLPATAAGIGVSQEQVDQAKLRQKLATPNEDRIFAIGDALRIGMTLDEIHQLTLVDPWFLAQLRQIIELEGRLKAFGDEERDTLSLGRPTEALTALAWEAKSAGFSNRQLARLWRLEENAVVELLQAAAVAPTYYLVDTCAAEFEAHTPYYYSTYERPTLADGSAQVVRQPDPAGTRKRKIMILGGGPNRIGQGIEFDYCCVHASFALKELGCETIMVNSNPETVSTDYDTSDTLYFEPVTFEDVMRVIERERPDGVIVQFGGQTPLNLAMQLHRAGVPIIGTSPVEIDRAEDREQFAALIERLGIRQPPNGMAVDSDGALAAAHRIGYPVLVRPSYVLGGRAMEILYEDAQLRDYMARAHHVSAKHPILIDKFLEDALEVDVDVVGDGARYVVGGILEHIEEAGIHSGDSAMVLPPHTLSDDLIEEIRQTSYRLAQELHVVGLMNVQYAIKDEAVYVLEVNPRASRTVPFIAKATGVPLAKIAAKAMAGVSLEAQGFTQEVKMREVAVKESVLPFARFSGIDILLGPEMKSTGEVMGLDADFGAAFLKAQLAAGQRLPTDGTVFISVQNKDKRGVLLIAQRLYELGFKLIATQGTAKALSKAGMSVEPILKLHEGRPNVLDRLKQGDVHLIINTPSGRYTRADEIKIRSAATLLGIPCITTVAGAQASLHGIEAAFKKRWTVRALQDYHRARIAAGPT